MTKARWAVGLAGLVVLAAAFLVACGEKKPKYATLEGQTMGTSYRVRFLPANADTQATQAAIDARLLAINKSMSTYDDSATIMAFNRAKAGERVEVDGEFLQVLQDAQKVWQDSHGAFDPTVQPLVLLWGFGKNATVDRLQAPPSPEEIAAAKAKVGLDKVKQDGNALYKTEDGVQLDFSAIAKGYGVDAIAQTLRSQGVQNYMVEIGGEIATKGKNAQGKAWQIAIDKPAQGSGVQNREVLTSFALGNDHMATSGDYRNSVLFDGVRYSHTINPTTGQPVQNGAASVTVLHDSVALADAWATALSALDQNDAIALAEAANISAFFALHDGNEWRTLSTRALDARLNAQRNQPQE